MTRQPVNHDGLVKAVVFDWAGTLIDHGSRAPVLAFKEAFAACGFDVTDLESRTPMGSGKRDHIRAMLNMPSIAAQWRMRYGDTSLDEAPFEEAIDRVYDEFLPSSVALAARHADLVPGASETIAWLRARRIAIGTTTGYTRAIMDAVLPRVSEQGFVPGCVVCTDEIPAGRPEPFGMYRCCLELGVAASYMIKVDDTVPGIEEGQAAGSRTIGVTMTGNAVGLDADALTALDETERDELRQQARAQLVSAGADYVIDSVADIPALFVAGAMLSP